MALGMKHWLGLVAAGCAAAALWLLPLSTWEPPAREPRLQEELREEALDAEAKRLNATLTRLRVAEEVIGRTLADPGPLSFQVPDGVDPQEVGRVRERVLGEVEAVGPGRRDVALGLAYVQWRAYDHPGAPTTGLWPTEYYYGERDGRAYCVTVLPTWNWGPNRAPTLDRVPNSRSRLGLCQLVARYGLPGEAVQGWLQRGGATLAANVEPGDPDTYAFATVFGSQFTRRRALGFTTAGAAPGSIGVPLEQCLAGMTAGCGVIFGDPSVRTLYGAAYVRGNVPPEDLFEATPLSAVHSGSILEPSDHHVVADLAAEFGADRVQRWWSADGDATEAFTAAFGVDPATWYGRRIARMVRTIEPGPRVSGLGALTVLLVLAGGTLVAGHWATRRSVA